MQTYRQTSTQHRRYISVSCAHRREHTSKHLYLRFLVASHKSRWIQKSKCSTTQKPGLGRSLRQKNTRERHTKQPNLDMGKTLPSSLPPLPAPAPHRLEKGPAQEFQNRERAQRNTEGDCVSAMTLRLSMPLLPPETVANQVPRHDFAGGDSMSASACGSPWPHCQLSAQGFNKKAGTRPRVHEATRSHQSQKSLGHWTTLQLGDRTSTAPGHAATEDLWIRLGNQSPKHTVLALTLKDFMGQRRACALPPAGTDSAERLKLNED